MLYIKYVSIKKGEKKEIDSNTMGLINWESLSVISE